MEQFVIQGGAALKGTVHIDGAKNAVLPLMAASLLADGPVTLRNVPKIGDITTLTEILRGLGVRIERAAPDILRLEVTDNQPYQAPYKLVREMRASICVLGPLLARRGRADVALPGGCRLGVRPIDLHLKGLRALGARVNIDEGYIKAWAPRLSGASMVLSGANGPTVLGTSHVMMAASLAEGATVIEGAASEPEVQEVANLLNAMGARITGIGTPTLTIQGVDSLKGVEYEVMSDRMEAGTFIAAAAITRGDVLVENAPVEHMAATLDVFEQIGIRVEREDGGLRVTAPDPFRPIEVATGPHPAFPTDMQPQVMSLLTLARGKSVVTESIFPERFAHVDELNRMRAQITKSGLTAIVTGVEYLSGAPVEATDLRCGAALVLAGLIAGGETTVAEVHHIDRGYQGLEEKLRALGADIERVTAPDEE